MKITFKTTYKKVFFIVFNSKFGFFPHGRIKLKMLPLYYFPTNIPIFFFFKVTLEKVLKHT